MKGFSLLLLVALISCNKQKNTTTNDVQQTVVKDCNCDRVFKVVEFNISGTGTIYDYWMINDCSGLQTFKERYGSKPVVGQCN